MEDKTLEALDNVAQINLRLELEGDADLEELRHKRAMEALNKYCEVAKLKNEAQKVENDKKDSRWNRIIAITGLIATVIVTPLITMAINDHHLRIVCQLENVDTLTSTGGKNLLRGMFKFK